MSRRRRQCKQASIKHLIFDLIHGPSRRIHHLDHRKMRNDTTMLRVYAHDDYLIAFYAFPPSDKTPVRYHATLTNTKEDIKN